MKTDRIHHRWTTAVALVGALLLATACSRPVSGPHGSKVASAEQGSATIRIDGSSTVYPITEAVAEEFQKQAQKLGQGLGQGLGRTKVTVGISGTGGGFKKFCRGETDLQDASRPISPVEAEACKTAAIEYIELPVAYDALTVVVHPSNTWAVTMIVADLKKIWAPETQGQVMRWNQVRPEWPDQPLKLYGPGADSGTFDYFTEVIVGKAKASRGDYTASEDDNVLVQGVTSDPNALGYFGYAYFAENAGKLKAVAIAERDGGAGVLPSPQTVEQGVYRPLARPIFIYVNKAAAARPEVNQFVTYYLQNAPQLVPEVKYIPLPTAAYALAGDRFQRRWAGSTFVGMAESGLSVVELMKRGEK